MTDLKITLGNLTGFGRRFVRDGCTGKRGFDSYAEAEFEIGRLIKNNAERSYLGQFAPYACGICHRFHLGHHRVAVHASHASQHGRRKPVPGEVSGRRKEKEK